MKTVSHCCFCINLRDGSLILGYLSAVGAVLNVSSLVRELVNYDDETMESRLRGLELEDCVGDDCSKYYSIFVGTAIAGIILDVLVFILSVLLIHGINKDKPNLMRPYISYVLFMIVMSALGLIVGVVLMTTVELAMGIFITIFLLVALVLNIHFFMVVKSYQLQMIQQPTRQMAAVPAFYPAAPMMMSSAEPGVVFANQQMTGPVGNMYHASPNVAHVSGAYVNQQMAAPVGNLYHASPNVVHVSGTYPPPLVESLPPPYV